MEAAPAPFGVEAARPPEPRSGPVAPPRLSGVYGLLIHSPRPLIRGDSGQAGHGHPEAPAGDCPVVLAEGCSVGRRGVRVYEPLRAAVSPVAGGLPFCFRVACVLQ